MGESQVTGKVLALGGPGEGNGSSMRGVARSKCISHQFLVHLTYCFKGIYQLSAQWRVSLKAGT